MSKRPDLRVFRSRGWLLVGPILMTLVCGAIAVATSAADRPVRFWVAAALAAFGLAGIVEWRLAFVAVGPDELIIRELLRTRRYARPAVADVSWAKGVGVSLRLSNGAVASVPDLGHSSSAVAGAVRAWLNDTRAT